ADRVSELSTAHTDYSMVDRIVHVHVAAGWDPRAVRHGASSDPPRVFQMSASLKHFSANPTVAWVNRAALAASAIGVLVFLVLPVLIVVPMSFSDASSLRFPPESFSLRWYAEVFGDPRWLQAMKTSLVLALLSSTLALVLGGLAAYGLVRGRFFGRMAAQSNFIAPLIIPRSEERRVGKGARYSAA